MGLALAHIPPPTMEQRIAGLAWSLGIMKESRVTAIEDALVIPGVGQTYKLLDERGELAQRVNLCLYNRRRSHFGCSTLLP
jgi:hypothetical protein